jgi:hypothetical protein
LGSEPVIQTIAGSLGGGSDQVAMPPCGLTLHDGVPYIADVRNR